MVEWWYQILGCVQIHRNFKGQNSKNCEKLNSRAENEKTRARGERTVVPPSTNGHASGTRGRGDPHKQPVVASGRFGPGAS